MRQKQLYLRRTHSTQLCSVRRLSCRTRISLRRRSSKRGAGGGEGEAAEVSMPSIFRPHNAPAAIPSTGDEHGLCRGRPLSYPAVMRHARGALGGRPRR